MTLIQCRECKNDVSDSAKACPKCGAKMPRKTSRGLKLFAWLIGISMVASIFVSANAPSPAPLSAADAAVKAKQEAEFQAVVLKVRALKASVKNPSSFELMSAILMPGGTLCVEFRATNSFNAVVPDSKAITSKNNFGDWNKECSGKSGTDYKRVRHAL